MKTRTDIEVIIDNKRYTLCGYESEEYLQKVASYINGKYAELKKQDNAYRLMDAEMKNVAEALEKQKKVRVRIPLNPLLQLVKMLLCTDFHKQENQTGQDAADPQSNLEQRRAKAYLCRDLLCDNIDVKTFFSDFGVQFV